MASASLLERLGGKARLGAIVILGVAGYVSLAYGMLIFGAQIITYLHSGRWSSLPASYMFVQASRINPTPTSQDIALLRFVPKTQSCEAWMIHPDSWFGWHRIVMWLLDFFSVPSLAAILGVALAATAEEQRRERNAPQTSPN